MQAAWKIHAPRKIMKGRYHRRSLLLPFRVQEQDCKVYSHDFFLLHSRAPAECIDFEKREIRVLYCVSKKDKRRCNGAVVAVVRAISFFVSLKKGCIEFVLFRLWNSAPAAFIAANLTAGIAAAGFRKGRLLVKYVAKGHSALRDKALRAVNMVE